MIDKVEIKTMDKAKLDRADLAHWLSRSPNERIEAVENLRKQVDGCSARLQRTLRIIKRS